jgi:hypothetical protein
MGKILFPKYFPFCPSEGLPAYLCNTSPRTLSQLMYEYWVAKTWRVKVFMSDQGAVNPPQPEYNFYFGINAGSEEIIPCTDVTSYIYKYGDITELEFNSSFIVNYTSESGLCSSFVGYFSRFSEGNDDSVNIGVDPSIQTGSVDVSFGDGHTLSLPIRIASQQDDPASYYELITGVEITIDEYWSYGGTYDTTTGALL